jgi:Rieske 2Fe-2S family protein
MLEQEYYTTESRYQNDLQLMRGNWHCLGHVSEIPRRGEFVLRTLVDAEVIVAQPADQRWTVLHNVCRHRALRLCTESKGESKGVLRCPYHGWSYDLDGNLLAAPNMADADGFEPSEYGLVPVTVDVWHGLIFASPTPTRRLSSVLEPLDSLVANWQIESLQVARTLEYDVAANWKLIVQNFSECYHCPLVHPQLNRLTPFRSAENQLDGGGPVMGGPMLLDSDAQTMSLDGRFAATPIARLNAEQRRRVYYYSVFPTTFISPHPDYVLLHRLLPLAVGATRVTCQILTAGEPPDARAFEQAVGFWDQTNRQDWEMCERSHQGVKSPGYRPGPYSNLESLLGEFDQYYLQQSARLSKPQHS